MAVGFVDVCFISSHHSLRELVAMDSSCLVIGHVAIYGNGKMDDVRVRRVGHQATSIRRNLTISYSAIFIVRVRLPDRLPREAKSGARYTGEPHEERTRKPTRSI
jgi:hypothetical protein